MKILVVGSGGREHAICSAFLKSSKVKEIFCANGNAGIAAIAETVDIRPDNIPALADLAEAKGINLTFVGGETSLALGIVDEFESRGLKIIGASKAAARLEASKAFAKDFMARHQIPTAAYVVANSIEEAKAALEHGRFVDENSPVVVKADGLAAGKGVVVAATRAEAIDALGELESIAGKEASSRIVLEECLIGREVSLILFCDGENFAMMPPTRDHKRIGEGDTGPNTGGMGTITDAALLSADQTAEIVETVIKPTLNGCREEGFPFRGILFLGLMMTPNGPKVLEYNVRFGDPETQSILVRLETDIVDICEAMLSGTLDQTDIKWRSGNSACVILAAENYPGRPRTGDGINGLESAGQHADVSIFHAGTTKDDEGRFVTAGGRVLGVTAVGDDLDSALKNAYEAAAEISWPGMQYRRDIGK
ncbi:MAG: phosphoribosylamine--glycine ligase [Pyrinomonadaceae bacterium]|nr:phosphoribosylamine--glycine ligase [Pyrinomonadaceae bacterium]